MPFARWQASIVDNRGNLLNAPTIEVRRESDNGLAVLYSDLDGLVPLGNPFTLANGEALAFFHAVGGFYKITAAKSGFSRTWRYVPLGTAQAADFSVDTDVTLAANSDVNVPSQRAIKTYVDAHINDASDAHDASAISNVPAGTIVATDVQAAINELDTEKIPHTYIDTDGTLSANSDTKLATQKATKTYVDQIIAAQDAMVFKGAIDASANPNYPAADRGHTYRISVAGKIGGASGVNVENGDLVMCVTDSTSAGDQATVGTNWVISQTNIDGAVVGPASATDGHAALFDQTNGKLIKSAGFAPADVGRQIISGGGLTGGGTLAADRTLAVGAGTGITVNTDDVAVTANSRAFEMVFNFRNGVDPIPVDEKLDIRPQFAGQFTGWSILNDQAATVDFGVWKDTYANFPPTNADSMTNSHDPATSAAAKAEDTNISDWTTTTFAAGDCIRVNVDANDDATRATLILHGVKTS
jgi:hypothetical protein